MSKVKYEVLERFEMLIEKTLFPFSFITLVEKEIVNRIIVTLLPYLSLPRLFKMIRYDNQLI